MDFKIISIGALSRHDIWGETDPVRTAHATTILVRSQDRTILVDPGLPPQIITARLAERSGLTPQDITDVFLTSFRPPHRWGLGSFDHANWLISDRERQSTGHFLITRLEKETDADARRLMEQDVALLQRCRPAPDRLALQVDLFPLPGFTAGTCGLLLSHVNCTTLVAGDAVGTQEHLAEGRILPGAYDAEEARTSLTEAIEIADVIIPGHDNLVLNPTRQPM